MAGLLHGKLLRSKHVPRFTITVVARQAPGVQLLVRIFLCLLWAVALPTYGAFSSLYVFGDGVCTTTNNAGGAFYYGNRYSNGRVWVEVLAQRQSILYESNKNWSFFGHYSPNLIANLNSFSAPAGATSALFVVWVNNADFVYNTQNYPFGNLAQWTNAINLSLSNHATIIQLLYGKGARTLVMPNAVDLSKVPYYVGLSAPNKAFLRQRVVDFNNAFATRLNQARTTFTNLTIVSPDAFALFDDLVAHAATYGLTNALQAGGQSVDALSDSTLTNKALNGPGANYIFWDYLDPSAKAHAVLADIAQQLLAPVRIDSLTAVEGGSQLELANVPVGRSGVVEGTTNYTNWATVQSFTSTNITQTVSVPAMGDFMFYRLRFPLAWSWP